MYQQTCSRILGILSFHATDQHRITELSKGKLQREADLIVKLHISSGEMRICAPDLGREGTRKRQRSMYCSERTVTVGEHNPEHHSDQYALKFASWVGFKSAADPMLL